MQESTVIQERIDRGVQKGTIEARRTSLLDVIGVRFEDPVPEPIRLAVEGTNDPTILTRWIKVAATAAALADLRAAMRQEPRVLLPHGAFAMSINPTIEERVAALEQTVNELRKQLVIPSPASHWLDQVVGSISDEEAFLEAMEYGREFRNADHPPDEPEEPR